MVVVQIISNNVRKAVGRVVGSKIVERRGLSIRFTCRNIARSNRRYRREIARITTVLACKESLEDLFSILVHRTGMAAGRWQDRLDCDERIGGFHEADRRASRLNIVRNGWCFIRLAENVLSIRYEQRWNTFVGKIRA